MRINNDHHSALILHISSIATNNHPCFEKFVRETISFWTETFPVTLNVLSTGADEAGTLKWCCAILDNSGSKFLNEGCIKKPIELRKPDTKLRETETEAGAGRKKYYEAEGEAESIKNSIYGS